MAEGKSAARGAAPERIAGELRAMIRSGRLAPETKLPPEPRLAERFGVSRSTLREALTRLAAEGLIRTRRGAGGGSFVARPDPDAARTAATEALATLMTAAPPEAFQEAASALVPALARLAALRRGPEDLARLGEEIARQRRPGLDDAAFCHSEARLYAALGRATRNALLEAPWGALIAAAAPALARDPLDAEARAEIVLRHARLCARLERRDAEGLARDAEAAIAALARRLGRVGRA